MDPKEFFLYVLSYLNLHSVCCQGQFYRAEDIPVVGLSHLDGFQVPEERQYGPPLGQSYDGFVNYDLPIVGDVAGQPYPVLEPQYPPVMSGYPVVEYPVPLNYGDYYINYDSPAGPWSGAALSPCNPSPSRYLQPPLVPDCGDYYGDPCQYQDPCLNCPCLQWDPCPPPYYCLPPQTDIPPTRPPLHPTKPAPTVPTTTSSCVVESGTGEPVMMVMEDVVLWLSSTHTGLSWFRADSLTAALGRDTGDWRLAELSTRERIRDLELLLNKEDCSLSSLNIWLGGNTLADTDWRWTTGDIIRDNIWGDNMGDTSGDTTGDCMMLRDRQWTQQSCAGVPHLPTVFLAQKGNFPSPKPRPTFVPPLTSRRPTVKPSTPADEKTTPNDNNLPPGPD